MRAACCKTEASEVQGEGYRVEESLLLQLPSHFHFPCTKIPPQCMLFAVPWCSCSCICMLILASTIARGSCCHLCGLLIISMQAAFTNAKSRCEAKAVAVILSPLYLQGSRMCVSTVCVCVRAFALLHAMITKACVCTM